MRVNLCLFCGEDAGAAEHFKYCNGRQGKVEAQELFVPPPTLLLEDEDDPRAGTIAERAERFHRRNPAVYRFAVDVCRYMRRKRIQHYGIGAVWEIMRFKYLETHGDIYKLNNNYRAFYARLIMSQESDLAGFFQTRDCPNDPEYYARPVRDHEVSV